MFQKPQHEHRSTGIASGLEYRDGYAVGGRVKPKRGLVNEPGGYAGHEPDDLKSRIMRIDPLIDPAPVTLSSGDDFRPLPPVMPINPRLLTGIQGPLRLRGEPKTSFTMSRAGTDLPVSRSLVPVSGGGALTVPGSATGISPALFPYNLEAAKVAGGLLATGGGGLGLAELISADSIMSPSATAAAPMMEDDDSLASKDSDTRRPSGIGEISGKKSPAPDPDSGSALDKRDKVDDAIKAFNSTDALRKARYQELDAELASLRAKQDDEQRIVSLLNIVSAANDPNLQQGQSRVAAGVNQLTEEARNRAAVKQARDESDIARKYERAEQDIQRKANREDYVFQKQIDAQYGAEGAQVKYMRFLLEQMGIDPGTEEAAEFIREKILGKKGQKPALAAKILESATGFNVLPGNFRMLYGIPAKKDAQGEDLPLDNTDLEAALAYIDEQVFAFDVGSDEADLPSLDNRVAEKDGGRVGFALGGEVTKKETDLKTAPIVMGYDQLKAFLPDFIPDNIIKLISSNPNAFREFAGIETNQDVDEFNERYDVRLVLPERVKMEEERVNVASDTMSNVTVPSAVAANPMTTPTQTSAGQLSPTETALLSPTEQAIKMRS